MRVLLIFPGLDFEVAYPLGLATIAGALLAAGHEVHGLDVALDGIEGLGLSLQQVQPQVVGIATWSPAFDQARAAAIAVHTLSRARLVLGGPHASLFPAESLAALDADAVVVGEGEQTVVELLAAWQQGRSPAGVRGLVWPDEQGLHHEPPRPLADLDALPLADRTVFDPARYPHAWARRAPHAAPIVTSRGCPLACAYCPTPALHHRRWRGRSPDSVLAEVRALPDLVQHLLIEDEHPTVDRARWLALCRALQQVPHTWSCPNSLRPETLDHQVVAAMAAAGCTRVALGIESTHQPTLDRLGRADRCASRAAASLCADHGIEVTATTMLGLPGAPLLEPLHQLREVVHLGASGAHFSLFQPLPGSAWADQRPAPVWLRPVRTGLYLGFYGHPRRLRRALRASHASLRDLPAAGERLAGWLRYGRRPGGGR